MSTVVANSALLEGSPYVGYTYSYPHKTAHRPLDPPLPLREVWNDEDRSSLFLYLHVPFCEMRCGFCNLFTTTGADDRETEGYLRTLERQAIAVRDELGAATFVRMAIGGGTPTYLSARQLERLLAITTKLGARPAEAPASVETSPKTATADRLGVLRAASVKRISIGVQTFDEDEARALGRPQRSWEVEDALDTIRAHDFPVLNIDLMYGGEHQTPRTWLAALDRALRWRPEELYLYPLYVRRLTGLAKRARQWDDQRLTAYRLGRDYLLSHGYRQVSMRMFRRNTPDLDAGPPYRCQEDGMVGLGCGARSYTQRLHYSWPYAVGKPGIRTIIADYSARPTDHFRLAQHGVTLDRNDEERRYILLSLLQADGLELSDFERRFGRSAVEAVPALAELKELGLTRSLQGRLLLTPRGLERSDAIGPWLYSSEARTRMETFEWR